MRRICLSLTMIVGFLFSASLLAGERLTFSGQDSPDDKGESIDLTWTLNDDALKRNALNIHVFRKAESETEFIKVKELDVSAAKLGDKEKVVDDTNYFYKLKFLDKDSKILFESNQFGPYFSEPQWFNRKKIATLIFTMIAIAIILIFIQIAKSGRKLYIRPLPGVTAIEEAVGRATEMGKPCLYIPGISVIEDIATLASISIVSKVSETIAEYNARMIIPNYDPIVYSVIDESVKNSYIKVGRPDAYDPNDVYYLTSRQFAYAAGVSGIIAREEPSAIFLLGVFYAESLIMAEAGSMSGAIQVAGTDKVTQIPFFIVACDYTLIGEELYAAGAYMGGDKKLLGGLKGQDYVKAVCMAAIVILFILKIAGVPGIDTLLTGG